MVGRGVVRIGRLVRIRCGIGGLVGVGLCRLGSGFVKWI